MRRVPALAVPQLLKRSVHYLAQVTDLSSEFCGHLRRPKLPFVIHAWGGPKILGQVRGLSVRAIARALNRSASTVSREIRRNGGLRRYRAEAADKLAWKLALRPKLCKLAICGQLRQAVATKLKRNWSPEQIAGWLKWTHPEDEARRVSHETIYRSLYVQARGVLKQELMAYLRSQRLFRRSRHATKKGGVHGQIVNAVSISERPASVEDRAVPGHWEGDLICGPNNSNIVTLVERHSRYVMLARIPSRDSRTVVNTLIKQLRKLPDELYKSLTWDRGSELAEHQRFTMATDVDVYFCVCLRLCLLVLLI